MNRRQHDTAAIAYRMHGEVRSDSGGGGGSRLSLTCQGITGQRLEERTRASFVALHGDLRHFLLGVRLIGVGVFLVALRAAII